MGFAELFFSRKENFFREVFCTAWNDDEIIEEEEDTERFLAEELLAEEESRPASDEIVEDEDDSENERKQLKRDVEAEALKRLEDAARTEEDFNNVVAWWDRLDANRERKERYHEISRSGDALPIDYGEDESSLLFAGPVTTMLKKQLKKGDFIETIFFRPQDIQELVTEGYLWAILKTLNARQKQLLFQKAILWYSTAEIGELRKQTDRNIRKIWNTLLNKLRKNALNDLRLKQKLGLPMMLEEKQFLSENGKPAVSRRKRRAAP